MTRVSRGDWTAIELFLAAVRGWEGHLRRRLVDGSRLLMNLCRGGPCKSLAPRIRPKSFHFGGRFPGGQT